MTVFSASISISLPVARERKIAMAAICDLRV
jgi:hypothetical protein